MEVLGLRLLVPATLLVLTGAIIDQRMIVAPGKTFGFSLASEIANLSSSCKCKMRCYALPSCSSWSFVHPSATATNTHELNTNTTESNTNITDFECRISDQGPEDLNLTVHANSIYGYKLSSIKSDIGVITGPDGLLYIKPPLQYPLQEMRDHCNKIPGFRLVILKTPLQFKFAKEYLATVAQVVYLPRKSRHASKQLHHSTPRVAHGPLSMLLSTSRGSLSSSTSRAPLSTPCDAPQLHSPLHASTPPTTSPAIRHSTPPVHEVFLRKHFTLFPPCAVFVRDAPSVLLPPPRIT
ncbi:hypothetical protein Pcinc_024086 [Petrolisthes cinctipes]|uniref:Apple domain-containing protein n=1 Tax=Petrolisthes cinctipes TaxID=88211 RepID=A0AAE1FAL0_PETCI|nr:hypothetical protein Pcinc_024086 [Petrolisthes cinctipes]